MNRRRFLSTAAAGLTVAACTDHAAAKPAAKPNIVLLLADDLGYADLSCYGSRTVKTPNLDALAKSGLRLTTFYAAAPVCSPSRAALLTGRYPWRAGVYQYLAPRAKVHLRTSETTLAEALDAVGYNCAHFGKWHLSSSFDGSQPTVSGGKALRDLRFETAFTRQHCQSVKRCRLTQARLAAAVDQLLHLGEELRLTDAAAAALEVIAGAERLALRIMVADADADVADFVDGAEVERAPPDERLYFLQKTLAQRLVTGAGAGADERRALPRQSLRFIIGNRGIDRQRDRRHFGRRPEAHVDARDIAVLGPLLQQLDQPPGDANRGLPRLVPLAARKDGGIEQQDQVDVGGIVEFAAAELAEGENREAFARRARHALGDGRLQRPVDRFVGKIGQGRCDAF